MSSTGKIQIDQLIGSENYIDQALRIKAILIKDNLLDPINEAIQPNDTKNLKALAIIQLFCAKGPLLYIKNCDTAYKAWKTLEDLYNPKGFTTEFLTLKELFDCKLESFNSMEEYLHQIKILLDDLSSRNIKMPYQIQTAWVLYNLGEEYKFFIQNIVQALRKDSKAYTFDSLCASLIDEAKGKTADQIYTAKIKQKNKYKKNNDLFCTNCKKTNHIVANCYFLHKEIRPSTWKNFENKEKVKKYEKNEKNNKKQEEKKKQALLNAIIDADSEKSNNSESEEEINILQDQEIEIPNYEISDEEMSFDFDLTKI